MPSSICLQCNIFTLGYYNFSDFILLRKRYVSGQKEIYTYPVCGRKQKPSRLWSFYLPAKMVVL